MSGDVFLAADLTAYPYLYYYKYGVVISDSGVPTFDATLIDFTQRVCAEKCPNNDNPLKY